MRTKLEWAIAILALTPGAAFGAGFSIPDQGAAALGMAGAFAAKADDVTAIRFNPAGIASLSGLQAYAGLVMVFGQPTATGPSGAGEETELIAAPLPQLYVSYGLPYDFAVGIGVFSDYGLKLEWPQGWSGRFLDTYVDLTTVTINPTIAWRPVRWLAIGVGMDVVPALADIERAVNLVDTEGSVRFRGNEVGLGGDVGVLFEGPIPSHRQLPLFSLGVTYRSRYDLSFDDGAITVRAPPELSGILHDARATARVPIPDFVSAGVGVRPLDSLFLQIQLDWVHWSRLQTLQLTAPTNPALNETIPEGWSDSYTLRAGGELALGRTRLRLGFGYDWTPVPAATLSPLLPDADRYLVSAGFGIELPAHLFLEASVMGVIFRSRTSELPVFPASYSNWAVLPAFSLSYRSPQQPRPTH